MASAADWWWNAAFHQAGVCYTCTETLTGFLILSFSLTSPDFNTDGYEGDGAEDGKSQDGSETLPYIDESPTMSPQLCVPQGPDGEAVSPTPPEGLPPGVGATHTHTHAVVRHS